jgi:hypothetical protein
MNVRSAVALEVSAPLDATLPGTNHSALDHSAVPSGSENNRIIDGRMMKSKQGWRPRQE